MAVVDMVSGAGGRAVFGGIGARSFFGVWVNGDVGLWRGFHQLTSREREVLAEVIQGRTDAEIAARFEMSEAAVDVHVGRIVTRVDLRDGVHVVIFVCGTGFVRPGH